MLGKCSPTASDVWKDDNKPIFRMQVPDTTFIIHITPDWCVHSHSKPPGRFQRWMMKVCFGWRIEVVE